MRKILPFGAALVLGIGCSSSNPASGTTSAAPTTAPVASGATSAASSASASAKPGGVFTYKVVEPKDNEALKTYTQVFAHESFAAVAKELSAFLVFPRNATVVARECGEINAWYDKGEHQLTLCY